MKLFGIVIQYILLANLLLFPGCENGASSEKEIPDIGFSSIPIYGTTENIEGFVSGVDISNTKVAVYIFVEGAGWWTKPSTASPQIPINHDRTWCVDVTTGGSDIYATRFHAFLIPNKFYPPISTGNACLPEQLFTISLADREALRLQNTVHFSGYDWYFKNSSTPVGPGPNFFTDNPENVWLDNNQNLHLKITKRGINWYCPEVILINSLGYGKYLFQLSGNIGRLNKNVVFGIFMWDNDACGVNHREIDIEFSRWSNNLDIMNVQYVIQPYNLDGNLHRWQIFSEIDSSTHFFHWQKNEVSFLSASGHQISEPFESIIHSWNYWRDGIPVPGNETVRLNLWLNNGIPPSDNQEVEVIINNFEFIPDNN